MDLSESKGTVANRHPWEHSRTWCVRAVMEKYLDRMHRDGKGKVYINAGAGDCYFDKALLSEYVNDKAYAIDIAYQDNLLGKGKRIARFRYLEEVPVDKCDYAVMMDSLEYMEDDAAYVKKVAERLKTGGYFFFTLPAFPILFSDYDVNIKNLRRYSRKTFRNVIKEVGGLEILEEYNFYTSLFLVRFLQKYLRLPIDPKHEFTAHWKYDKNHFMTRFLTGCLNFDYRVNELLGRIGIRLPGLSMIVVCRKAQRGA